MPRPPLCVSVRRLVSNTPDMAQLHPVCLKHRRCEDAAEGSGKPKTIGHPATTHAPHTVLSLRFSPSSSSNVSSLLLCSASPPRAPNCAGCFPRPVVSRRPLPQPRRKHRLCSSPARREATVRAIWTTRKQREARTGHPHPAHRPQ